MVFPDEPIFCEDDCNYEPPAHVCTVRLIDVLATLPDHELASWPEILIARERERRRRVGGDVSTA